MLCNKKEGVAHLHHFIFRICLCFPQLYLRINYLNDRFSARFLIHVAILLELQCFCASLSSSVVKEHLKQLSQRCSAVPSNAYAVSRLLQEANTFSLFHQGDETVIYQIWTYSSHNDFSRKQNYFLVLCHVLFFGSLAIFWSYCFLSTTGPLPFYINPI